MNVKRRVGFGVLLAGLLILTGFLLRDVLLAHLVKPVALLLWAGSRLLSSIDQAVYWTGLILALALVALLRYARQPEVSRVDRAAKENGTLNSIRHWRTLIALSSDETGRLNYLKQSMRALLSDLAASRQPPQAAWKAGEDVAWEDAQEDAPLPPSVRVFLLLDTPPATRPGLAQRLRGMPARLVRRWTRRLAKQDQAEYYRSIAEVIAYMEKQLESDNEP